MSVLTTGALIFPSCKLPSKKNKTATHFVSETIPSFLFPRCEIQVSFSVQGSRPAFDRALNDITVDEGEKVSLECWVHGKPKPTITWYHNDKKIKNDSDYKQSYKGKH